MNVAIVGGGLSGTLLALNLARAGARGIVLIERAREPGRGVAYSTDRPEHLLNVPALRMSAFVDNPDHFARWYEARGGDAEGFAPRMMYGDYVTGLLAEAGDAIEIVRGEAVDVDDGGVRMADGRRIAADIVVLAPGNLAPATPGGIDARALGARWIGDPWASDFAAGLGDDDIVLLVGTGLTAVDAALTLEARGFGGRILALSRRGLVPRAHGEHEPATEPQSCLPSTCVALLRRVRQRAAQVGWHSAVHELRPVTQAIWVAASLAERRRFLRHLRPWWDVHRHRIAPKIATVMTAMQASRKLRFAAGKIVAADADGTVRWRPRGSDETETVTAALIVNCTGPEANLARAGEPLLDALLGKGAIRADECRIGLEVDAECRAIGADGAPSERLYVIGPVTKGAFWESVAVPDIRVQAARIAARIAASA
jgi:uncharacterized NAD(P)/FAD-binding protein YdhS